VSRLFIQSDILHVSYSVISRLFDAAVRPSLVVPPGTIAPDVDLPLEAPDTLPCVTSPNKQERFSQTPIYSSLL
jgi:hypothetical protein